MRLRNIKNAEEILNQNEHVIKIPQEQKGKWQDVFKNNQAIYLEIGTGKGNFIYEMAKKFPNINFIGMEKHASVLIRALEKIEDEQGNLRFICEDASHLLDLFQEQEIGKIYLNFSDPWPKARHEKRRLTHENFLKKYQIILKEEGEIEMKTDNQLLFEYSLESFQNQNMNIQFISRDLHKADIFNIMTEYERKFSISGPIYKIISSYRRKK